MAAAPSRAKIIGSATTEDGQAELHSEQLAKARDMLRQQAASIAQIATETGLTRRTVYRIKGDPAVAEAAPSPPPVGIVSAPEPYVFPRGVGCPAGFLRADRQAVDVDEVWRRVRV